MDILFKVGDLVDEKEGSRRAGIVVEVKEDSHHAEKTISVMWRTGKKTNHKPAWLKLLHTKGDK
jgi:hypothetical protein